MAHLQRGTRKNQPVPRRVVLVERLAQFRLYILHPVTLVDDHVDPLDLGKHWALLDDVFVRREADGKVVGADAGVRFFALRRRSLEDHDADVGRPALKLHVPVGQGRQGHNDEERPALLFLLDQVRDERDGLDRLAETLLASALARAEARKFLVGS